jgi:hypothetical protein
MLCLFLKQLIDIKHASAHLGLAVAVARQQPLEAGQPSSSLTVQRASNAPHQQQHTHAAVDTTTSAVHTGWFTTLTNALPPCHERRPTLCPVDDKAYMYSRP